LFEVLVMPRVVKRSAGEAMKTRQPGGRQDAPSPLPRWIPPQLCQPVETAPSGPQWLHEIKLDGFRMSARIERGRVQLLTRTGLDWSDKYPNVVAALAKVRAKTAYLDGELCGVGDDGLPSFSQTQAASDGSHRVRLVYYVFDLLHLDGRDTASLALIERKALLKPLVADIPGLQFNDHETGDLFADRTSTALMRANQLRLWFASMAYALICALRRLGLAHTSLADATCGTIRLKLLKLGALIRISARRVKIAFASACPAAPEWRLAAARLANARGSPARNT
jgi:hypothetical protein